MAKFLKGNELNSELEKMFEDADEEIILVSPYIKLHDRYSSTLLEKLNNPNINIVLLFGKNEEDMSKSMKQKDFEFFKQFPNVEILYEKRLHAKYYANEKKAILTSMNLYGYSQNNNIEVGILIESSFKGQFTGDNDVDAKSWDYFLKVIDQAELLFQKVPVFEKKNILSSSKYVKSEIKTDKLSAFFSNKNYTMPYKKTEGKSGFCIRTREKIPFNPKQPMTKESWKKWNVYKNVDFPEKYCHKTGEESSGKTTMKNPIL